MPIIRSLATALPAYAVPQETVRELARAHFAPAYNAIDRYMPVFRHAQIDTRYFSAPPEWFQTPRTFKECNDLFITTATTIGEEAAQRCLASVGITPTDIDHLIVVSTTGLAAPSLDAILINRMGMQRHIRRTPIWGLGCAGGVAGLARAEEYARAFPDQRVLLLTVELCSVTFQWNDRSKRNLIAASLFADGAAAVLVEGDAVAHQRSEERDQGSDGAPGSIGSIGSLQIIGTQSTIWPDTLDVMGWNIIDTGMGVVFSSRIPRIVEALMRENVAGFLTRYGLTIDDVQHWILHPGGAKVITAYESALGIDPERLTHTRDVLRRYGNMSSGTIFFVLEAFAQRQTPRAGEYGVLAVLGPGFSCELALVRG